MIEKKGSLYNMFKQYLKPNIVDWAEMKSNEALLPDAPEIVRDAFDEYVKQRRERLKEGKIV